MRTIAIFSVGPLWTPHFETELDLALAHAEQGDRVEWIRCRGELPACSANPAHGLDHCILCRGRSNAGARLLRLPPSQVHELHVLRAAADFQPPALLSVGDLRALRIDGVDLGEAAASSLISQTRDPDPDMTIHGDLARRFLLTAVGTYREAQRLLRMLEPDAAYVFNGRTAETRALIRACSAEGVPFNTHEAAYELGAHRLVPGSMVHDLAVNKRSILETWEASGDATDRRRVGASFFEGRRRGGDGAPVDRYRFDRLQDPKQLPDGFDPSKHNISIFNSSEDEFAAISSYDNPVYPDQMVALEQIIADERLTDAEIWLRVHPNLIGVSNRQTRHLAQLPRRANLHVVAAEAKVNTYELIEHSNVVVTFGSTVGIEATYWGTKSVLVGRALYEDLGPRRPTSHEEVIRELLDDDLAPDPEGPLKYGYWLLRDARSFAFYEQTSYDSGHFMGQAIDAGKPRRLLADIVRIGRTILFNPGLAAKKARARLASVRQPGP